MRCAADRQLTHRRARRTAALRCAALIALVSVAAGCTGGGAGHKRPAGPLARRGFFAQGAVIITGSGLIAAGGGRHGGRPQISVPPIPRAGSPQPITMPLDVYEEVASQEQDALGEAQTLLIQRCMTARGFSYPAPATPNAGFQALQGIEQDPFGLVSMSRAETYGYAQPKGSSQQGLEIIGFVGGAIFAGALTNHGPAYTTALFGFGPGGGAGPSRQMGCFQQAASEIYGRLGGNPDPDPVPGIAAQASQWAQNDPRVLAAERAWSRCMARRGYSYRTPLQAQQHGWPSAPTTGEVATAVADVSCKTRTNLPNTWLTVEAAYQSALVAQNLTVLSQLQANFQGLLQRAEGMLGGQPLTS
jgi:hypothetical protein